VEYTIADVLIQLYVFSDADLTRNDVDIQVNSIPDNCQQKYPSWQTAFDVYSLSYYNNEVKVFPKPNSCWWTEPIRVRDQTQLDANTSTSSEEALWAMFADEDAAARIVLELTQLRLN
jgi:hypothetical protein